MTNQPVIKPSSPKPVISPLANILKDDKAVLGLIGLGVAFLIQVIPALAPSANVLTLIVFILFSFLVGHQGVEDILKAWRDSGPTDVTYQMQLPPDEAAG